MTEQLKKLTGENRDLTEELRDGQEKLRLSNAQQQKLINELNDHKQRLGEGSQQAE